jgi:hypothetical protein
MSSLNFNVCDEVFGAIADSQPNHYPLSNYPTAQRVVVAVWHFAGIIENSGFHGLLERDIPGDSKFELLQSAFEALGPTTATQALCKVLELISVDGNVPDDRNMRVANWAIIPEAQRDNLESRFYDGAEEMTDRLATYIKNNDLLPDA